MKSCPKCQRSYEDTESFCHQDGTPLLSASSHSDSEPTLQLDPSDLNLNPAQKTEVLHRAAPTVTETAPTRTALIAGITAAAVLLLVLAGVGIGLLLRGPSAGNQNGTTNEGSNRANSNVANKNVSTTPKAHSALGIKATASSTRSPIRDLTYVPGNVLDQSLTTAWIEGVSGPGTGEWIQCDFDSEVKLNRIIITPGYFKTPAIWKQNNRLSSATFYFSDGSSRRFTFPDQMVEQRLDVGGVRTRSVRMVIGEVYSGSVDNEDTPISTIAFDWEQ